jgi:teichuronic acid biosynthesis glycosyltransferase TuaC
MRILYLCKRHYMGHDVIEDKYARLYEHPYQLAELDHNVLGVCLSYRKCSSKDEQHSTIKGNLKWKGLSLGLLNLNVFTYLIGLLKCAKEFRPNIVMASSDCLQIIIGAWIAKKCGAKFIADLYDDYETFGLARIPFIKALYRHALSKADLITCVSVSLTHHIKNQYKPIYGVTTLVSTINQEIFKKYNKATSRDFFKLPSSALLVGTAGGLTLDKGIRPVYQACLELLDKNPNVHAVFAGGEDKEFKVPAHPRIHFLGKLSHNHIALLFSALDVGIIYLRDTQYGRLSFPQKAYEMLACGIPIVAADVGDMKNIFDHNALYKADDHRALLSTLEVQLNNKSVNTQEVPTWESTIQKLNIILLSFDESRYR